ncbi:MAG: chitobiase/beta-hexosaminidase C-terminal domain-containing protein [Desulfobacterales bacterium]|nr:chitobiase/beta-hexosaminidase C-terminal domain-containing protein [Desulfobacterales bacterium]
MNRLRITSVLFGFALVLSIFPAGVDAGLPPPPPPYNASEDAAWEWQNPLPQGNTLNGIWGSSGNKVFAVGDSGTILHYDGSHWSRMSSGTYAGLNAVWGSSRSDVFAVGGYGTILHYDGSEWSEMSNPLTGSETILLGVWGSSGSDVFAVGGYVYGAFSGTILHYDGSEWSEMSTSTTDWLKAVWGSSGSDVFAVGELGTILHYDGSQWSEMSNTKGLNAVWGRSGNDVFAVGCGAPGTILHYDGSQWNEMTSDTGSGCSLLAVWGNSGSDVFLVGCDGSGGMILHYDGSQWSEMSSGTTQWLSAVWGSSGNDVFAVGGSGTILHYDGSQWSEMSSGTTNDLSAVWGSSGNDVFAGEYGGRILHYDGSQWSEISSGTTDQLMGIWGSSGSDVFAVGYSGWILHYDGSQWSKMTSGTYCCLLGVWGSSGNDVFAVADSGTILHYDGSQWSEMTSDTYCCLLAVWGSSGSDVFAVGCGASGGTILHYDGSQWSEMSSGTTEWLNAVWGSSGSDVFAVGDSGTILHYDGNRWSEMSSGTTEKLNGVWGSSGNDVFVVGPYGTILHYDGNQWSEMTNPLSGGWGWERLNAVWGTSGNDLFVVGDSGAILHYSKIGGATISGGPAGITNQTEATLIIGGEGVTYYKCKLDDGQYSNEIPVSTNINLTALADGVHTVFVIGRDDAGNWQSTDSSTTATWTVDSTKPVLTGLMDDTTPTQSKTWTWDANETATFRFAIDQNAAWTPKGTFTSIDTATKNGVDGIWYLHVQARDAAGNESEVVTVSAVLNNVDPFEPAVGAMCEQHDFDELKGYYHIYSYGRSWDFNAENNMTVQTIEVRSVLASKSSGGTFHIQVKINGNVEAEWDQYVQDTTFKPYTHSANVNINLQAGDTITYHIYGGTFSDSVGGIYGDYENYVKLCAYDPTPVFAPLPGVYAPGQEVTISCAAEGVVITYTTDGSDPTESSTQYIEPISLSETTTLKARAFKTGENPSDIITGTYIIESLNEAILYLRGYNLLSDEMGDPIPWIIQYVDPQGATTSIEWQTNLEGDISGSFYYNIDIVESESLATLKIEFIVDQDGNLTTAATKTIDVGILPSDSYLTESDTINGLDLQTQDGDVLIFRISHVSGTESVGIGLDGVADSNDSHIKVNYRGPVACFTVLPEGNQDTLFNLDASCSFDNTFSTSDLQVRWDWENDGIFDTAYTLDKTAIHQYMSRGTKHIRLQVKNPDGLTRTKVKSITIDLVVLDFFSSPGPSPCGLAWDGTYLWLSDGLNDTIYKLSISGNVVSSFASPCGDPMDLAWDGTYLWIIDAWGTDDKGNILYKVDSSGNIITSFEVPSDINTGLTWDGYFLWAADCTNNKIFKLDPDTGDVVASFSSPGPDPRGLAWDGQYLWCADFSRQEIYQLDVNGNVMNTFQSQGTGPMGLTWDDSNLWSIDSDSYTIYQLTDRIPTTITCELSHSYITFGEGELLTVSGHISPSPGEAGKGISIEFIPPSGPTVYKATLADINGQFEESPLECGDIQCAGTWVVRTSWAGDDPYEGATSEDQTLEVSKAESRVTLDVTSHAIKLNDLVSISGKFTPQPNCGGNLSGISIELDITGPDGTSDTQTVTTNEKHGHFLLQNYDGFNALGEWTIKAVFSGNDAYSSSDSDLVQVRVVETAGYAILVQGKISSEEGIASHNKTIKFVYNKLKGRGLLDDDINNDIMYFNYDTNQPGVDDMPSKTAIQDAITQWAKDKMNNRPANLYIVMLDHGLKDVFYIHPDIITSTDLAGWLNVLQAGLTGQASDQEIVLILGFCRSGSFIDDLSGDKRVIIASAAPGESSYKGPLDDDRIREGEYFISEFFKSVSFGKSIKKCFQEAVDLTEVFTSSGSGSVNAPYYDESLQHPLLDDNGDGVGSNDLSDPDGDGYDVSLNLFIGVSSLTGNAPGDVIVTHVAQAQFLGSGEDTVDLWARVDDNYGFSTIWVEVKPPDFVPVGSGESGQAYLDLPKTPTIDYNNDALDRWEWKVLGGFSEPGMYQVFYFAKDNDTGNVSPLMESKVYKDKHDNAPPNPFSLLGPEDGTTLSTVDKFGWPIVLLDWEDTTDPNNDRLSYTVLLSKGDDSFSDPIRKEGLAYSTCLVSSAEGIEDLSTYYWKVQAIDEYGAIEETGVRMFKTHNANPFPLGWIRGHVYNSITGQSITDAVVSMLSVTLNSALGGYYLGEIDSGTYDVEATAEGYNSKSYSGVVIPAGGLVTKDFGLDPIAVVVTKGDCNGDGKVDLADAVLALQVLAGIAPSVPVCDEADVNGDSRIGLAETMYIIRELGN